MTRVIVRRSSYHDVKLKPHIFEMLSPFGMDTLRPETRVPVKPNFLSSASPEESLPIYPAVVRAGFTVEDSPAPAFL